MNSEVLDIVKNMCLFDDTFMSKVFENNIECTQLIVNIILGREDIIVKDVKTQFTNQTIVGKESALDVYAVDSEGRPINIEVQRNDIGASRKRARYYSSLIDTYNLYPKQKYDELPESYVIFITENDVLRQGLPVYKIDRVIEQIGEKFGDGSHIVYVNGSYRGNDDLGKLMFDFSQKTADNIYFEKIKDRVKYLKNEKEGVNEMCALVEEYAEKKAAAVRAEGRVEGSIAALDKLLKEGLISAEVYLKTKNEIINPVSAQ